MADDIHTPLWLIAVAVEPKSKADEERLTTALATLTAEDPSLSAVTDQESGVTMVRGMSELHVDIAIDILRRAHGVGANIGAPQVAYLESVTRRAEVDHTHNRQIGSWREFAAVKLIVEPNEPGRGHAFEARIVGALPQDYVVAIEKGIRSVLGAGVVAGFPVVDIKVALVDAKYDAQSSASAFELAARVALRDALREAKSVLLEPIMEIEVVTPTEYNSSVVGDLKSRRAHIQDRDVRRSPNVIRAMVPFTNTFGYVNTLRAMSDDHATFTMQFDHYAPVPVPEDYPPFRPAIGMRA
jgi:elongation factor G